MINIIDEDLHYVGKFNLDNEVMLGEIIYNQKKGLIILDLRRKLKNKIIHKHYTKKRIIRGELNNGTQVTLLNNICTFNNSNIPKDQNIVFRCEKLIWSYKNLSDLKFNRLDFEISNALNWCGFSNIKKDHINETISFNSSYEKKEFEIYDSKVVISTNYKTEIFDWPIKEESIIKERVYVEIHSESKKDLNYFINIRDNIINMICFAIKDNINIEEQRLYDKDDYYISNGNVYLNGYILTTSEKYTNLVGTRLQNYNFFLNDLKMSSETLGKIEVLEPIFNLYLSLFKYEDMPTEMVFLNIVQAIETFHSRFFYKNRRNKYLTSVETRYPDCENNKIYRKLLLSADQNEANYIILFSRINDLLLMAGDVFCDLDYLNGEWTQKVTDTRHYYTHYSKSKENKIIQEDDLDQIIYILNMLLEYHVCKILGIDKTEKIKEEIKKICIRNNDN